MAWIIGWLPEFEQRCLRDASDAGGDGHEEGGGAQGGVDGDHAGAEGGGGRGAAHEQQETEHAGHELEEEHCHGGQAQPAVDAVEVRDGFVRLELVIVPGGDEAHHDAGDGQQVEHGVKQLAPDSFATSTRAIHQHS